MEKEFIPYEQALALKELGFNETCLAQYKKYDVGEATLDIGFSKNEIIMQFHKLSKFCSAPLYQQAFRWFREKYGCEFHIECRRHTSVKYYEVFLFDGNKSSMVFGKSLKYEDAELECLKKLIEIVKKK